MRGPGFGPRWLVAPLALAGLAAAELPPVPTPVPRRHVVEIRAMRFVPAVLEVAAGDTIVWINHDLVPHTATARGNVKWDTGTLLQGEAGQVVARRGEVQYECLLHPVMRGTLRVR